MIDQATIKKLTRKRPKTPNVLDVELAGWSEGDKSLFAAPAGVRGMAQNLIDIDHVDDHAHLREAKILILMRTGAKKDADGLVTLGTARRMSGLMKTLFAREGRQGPEPSPDFTLELNADRWDELEDYQQLALIDHELTHCAATIAGKMVGAKKLPAFVQALGDDHVETCDDVADDKGRVLVRYRRRTGGVNPGETGYEKQPLKWRVRKHDVEEFVAVFGRWGRWTGNLARMIDEMDPPDDGQLSLAAAAM